MDKRLSVEHARYLRRERGKSVTVVCVQIIILAIIFIAWELLAKYEIIDSFIFSSPSKMWASAVNLWRSGQLINHISATLSETVIGFLSATLLGLLIAIILWYSNMLQRVFEPYIVVLNALPKIALGPIIIIWFGAGKPAIIIMAILIAIIITIINMLSGFMSVDKEKLLLMKTFSATKTQTLIKLVLPANIPTIMSALKINVGMAWVGTIMGEYLVSREGIGYLIVYGGQVFNLSLVMCSTVILTVLAGLMYFVIALIEKIVVRKIGQ